MLSSQLAVNHRVAVCKFTEDVLNDIMKLHSNHPSEDMKSFIFRILHLSIVVHHPTPHSGESCTFSPDTARSVPPVNYVHDTQVWYKQLRAMHHIVDSEIKESSKNVGRSQNEPKFCGTFVSMAAALCAVVSTQ